MPNRMPNWKDRFGNIWENLTFYQHIMPWHWPGHSYLGPGTSNLKVTPFDEDDYIAKLHDLAYENSRSAEDIYKADRSAIHSFGNDFLSTFNPHSAVAGTVLGIKHGVETLTGTVFYPQIAQSGMAPTGKRDLSMEGEANVSPEHKRAKRDDPDSSMRSEGDEGGGAGGSVTSNPMQICRSSEALAFGKNVIFKKSWILTTWGFATDKAVLKEKQYYLKTPLAYIPVECLPFYMAPGEFNQLPGGATAKACFVKCTGKGYRFPFETSTSVTASANSEMVLFGQTASHLNHKYNLGFREYIAAKANPCVITGAKPNTVDWENFFYGTTTDCDAAIYPWLHKRLTHYAVMNVGGESNDGAYLPTLYNDVNTFDMRSAQGIPVQNYSYEFNIAPLKDKHASVLCEDYKEGPTGTRDLAFQSFSWNADNIGSNHYDKPKRGGRLPDASMYKAAIEKQQYWSFGSKVNYKLLAQPDCYVGVIPPMTSNPFGTVSFQPVMAYWQFDTTLVVDFNYNSTTVRESTWSASKNRYIPNTMVNAPVSNMSMAFNDARHNIHTLYEEHVVHAVVAVDTQGNVQPVKNTKGAPRDNNIPQVRAKEIPPPDLVWHE